MNVELNIEHVGSFGQGVGKDANGNVYFVAGAVPGDRVVVSYEEGQKRFRDATLVNLLSPSDERVQAPACQYFPECGGCDWLHWNYSAQLKAKASMVQHVLERNGVEVKQYLPIRPSEQPLGYRNRIQVRQENSQLGFYKRKSHDIVNIDTCAVAHPKINESLARIKKESFSGRRKLELVLQEDGEVAVFENERHAARGFAQVNEGQNTYLKSRVRELVSSFESKSVLELYCGDGNLSFSASAGVKRWIGIDSDPQSIERARKLREARGLSELSFFPMTVDRKLWGKLPEDFAEHCDTLILDPPRDGCQGALEQFLGKGIKRIIYISCSPLSFSKDIQDLKKEFSISFVEPVDMFPQTRHVELLAVLERF